MRKYEIRKMEKEVRDNVELVKGITLGGPWEEPDTVETFGSELDALNALDKYKTNIANDNGYNLVTEYYIECNEYDEDGGWIGGGDVLEITDMIDAEE